jgi:hypothetical protein
LCGLEGVVSAVGITRLTHPPATARGEFESPEGLFREQGESGEGGCLPVTSENVARFSGEKVGRRGGGDLDSRWQGGGRDE